MGVGEGVARDDLTRGLVVQYQVHFGKACCGDFLFLTVDGDFKGRLVGCLDEQRAGTAGRVVNRPVLVPLLDTVDADHLDQNTGDLSRCIELAFALAALGGKVAHQIFVGVAQNIVPAGLVGAEVKLRALENGDQPGELVHHLLTLAQFGLVVKMGVIDHAAQLVVPGFGQLGNHLVHALADVLGALQRDHIIEAAALGYGNISIFYALEFVRDILHKQQGQNIILVLRSIHAAAQLVTACPEGAVNLIFLYRHATNLGFSRYPFRGIQSAQ